MAKSTHHEGCLENGFRTPQVPPKLFRIGEVVEFSGFSRQTIHNYATMGLIHEARWTRGGHRLFGEEVFGQLAEIARMKSKDLSLREIREHLTGQGDSLPARA
jgi:DNA-binding transcriptional MerR regulator